MKTLINLILIACAFGAKDRSAGFAYLLGDSSLSNLYQGIGKSDRYNGYLWEEHGIETNERQTALLMGGMTLVATRNNFVNAFRWEKDTLREGIPIFLSVGSLDFEDKNFKGYQEWRRINSEQATQEIFAAYEDIVKELIRKSGSDKLVLVMANRAFGNSKSEEYERRLKRFLLHMMDLAEKYKCTVIDLEDLMTMKPESFHGQDDFHGTYHYGREVAKTFAKILKWQDNHRGQMKKIEFHDDNGKIQSKIVVGSVEPAPVLKHVEPASSSSPSSSSVSGGETPSWAQIVLGQAKSGNRLIEREKDLEEAADKSCADAYVKEDSEEPANKPDADKCAKEDSHPRPVPDSWDDDLNDD